MSITNENVSVISRYPNRRAGKKQKCEKCNNWTWFLVKVEDRWAAWCGCSHEVDKTEIINP